MKKLLISLVIEGMEEDLHDIKGKIIEVASSSIVSVTTSEISEPKKELDLTLVNLCVGK